MIIPVLVATTYEKRGSLVSHHVVKEVDDNSFRPVRELCAEHLIDACVNCGRSPGQHDELANKVKAGVHPKPKDYGDCDKHRGRDRCKCDLERWNP